MNKPSISKVRAITCKILSEEAQYIRTQDHQANILTKVLLSPRFEQLRRMIETMTQEEFASIGKSISLDLSLFVNFLNLHGQKKKQCHHLESTRGCLTIMTFPFHRVIIPVTRTTTLEVASIVMLY